MGRSKKLLLSGNGGFNNYDENLVWAFQYPSGNELLDSSGNGNNLTAGGSPSYASTAPNIVGQYAIKTDGMTGWFTSTAISAVQNNAMSWSFWVYPTLILTNLAFVERRNASGAVYFIRASDSGTTLVFTVVADDPAYGFNVEVEYALQLNTWQHIGVTWNAEDTRSPLASDVQIYIDGVVYGTGKTLTDNSFFTNGGGLINPTAIPDYIVRAYNTGAGSTRGRNDEFFHWSDRIILPEEMADIYNKQSNGINIL